MLMGGALTSSVIKSQNKMKSTSSSHEKVNTKIFENAEDNIERRPFIWIKSEHELFFVNMNCRVRFVFKQFEQLATMFGYEFCKKNPQFFNYFFIKSI